MTRNQVNENEKDKRKEKELRTLIVPQVWMVRI